ncbi:M48 family metallopeptidase [Rufibacter roseus]|uniref:M48 family metallopeptidase n=1 Tax=Rufibacter roseus TaxID=1567108 RepID=A0ABW2DKM7_9BACT|nr:SprT family zinc-dependent metalloprotease [Rufibacter roseus]
MERKKSARPNGILEKEIQGVGKVRFVPSATAKYVRISIRPEQGVRVTLPKRATLEQAVAFVQEKASWIQKHLTSQQQEQHKKTLFSPEQEFSTRYHQLLLQPHSLRSLKSNLKEGKLTVWYPEDLGHAHPEVQAYVRDAVEHTLRLEAKRYLPQQVSFYAQKFGFRFNKVVIKNAKTRWGSCSAINNINLNLHLMRLPEHLCDYVILHELAHTVEKNHGPRFWALLDKISGDARGLDRQLKAYRLQVY